MQVATRTPRTRGTELWVPLGGAVLVLATVACGLALTAAGVDLGTALPPFTLRFRPRLDPLALAAAALLAAGAVAAPLLVARPRSPWRFAAAAFVLGLALRVFLGSARGGLPELYSVFQLGRPESASEYLPALPALDFGARLFLDTFAQVGTSLTVNAVGHPPGLLLVLHWLGIGGARAMAALTIGAGALSVPLLYPLARGMLDERHARLAVLLYAFAPSALIYGATSADALYATLALLAALPLCRARGRAAPLGVGAAALAVASFFSYANLAIGAYATLLAARREGFRRAAALAAACAIGLIAFYGLLYLAAGYDPLGAIQAAESVYREGVASYRPYAFWLFGSPAAFLVAAGLPVAWFALRSLGAGHAPALALGGVLLAAALLGFTKAETERIYLFLVPLLCIAAAASLPEERLPAALAALAAQALATELLFYTVW